MKCMCCKCYKSMPNPEATAFYCQDCFDKKNKAVINNKTLPQFDNTKHVLCSATLIPMPDGTYVTFQVLLDAHEYWFNRNTRSESALLDKLAKWVNDSDLPPTSKVKVNLKIEKLKAEAV